MERLRWPMDVLARETNRSPRPAERSDRRDKSETGQMTCLRYRRDQYPQDTVDGQSSNLELYPGRDWQPVKSVTIYLWISIDISMNILLAHLFICISLSTRSFSSFFAFINVIELNE